MIRERVPQTLVYPTRRILSAFVTGYHQSFATCAIFADSQLHCQNVYKSGQSMDLTPLRSSHPFRPMYTGRHDLDLEEILFLCVYYSVSSG